ncbi:hypothetical protein D3C71_1509790 [compost metagenome]
MFIGINHNSITLTLRDFNCHDFFRKKAFGLRACGALLARQGKLVLICTIHVKLFSHVFGSLGHGVYTIQFFKFWVNETPAHGGVFNLLATAKSTV